MKREDKFGNPIYDRPWKEMCRNAKILENLGYKEAKKKPNLFYLKTDDGMFYADMRGTKEVPIWEDTSPLLYWKFSGYVPDWRKRRLVKKEMYRLAANGCHTRLSFYVACEPGGLMFNPDEDGYCSFCGKDFQDSGSYCSDTCALKVREAVEDARRMRLPTCIECGARLEHDEVIKHHVSYEREIVVHTCRPCHQKIHRSEDSDMKPPEGESKIFYAKKGRSGQSHKERRKLYEKLFHQGNSDREIADVMGVTVETVRRRRRERDRGKWLVLTVKCENCGTKFNGGLRTTCPKCRTFFR